MIGITGATGHLGSTIMRLLPDAQSIGYTIPPRRFDAIIHTAAPNYRNHDDVMTFRTFNRALLEHTRDYPPDTLIVTGSWWQYATGSCQDLTYTMLKNEQQAIFPNAVHLIPFSIYGDEPRPGRGFIPQLINTINTGQPLTGLSNQLRDFIHVTDVARAHIQALEHKRGIYDIATRRTITPADLAGLFNITAPDLDEYPHAYPRYITEPLPGWTASINVIDHINARI